jgi:hypothetical protein
MRQIFFDVGLTVSATLVERADIAINTVGFRVLIFLEMLITTDQRVALINVFW